MKKENLFLLIPLSAEKWKMSYYNSPTFVSLHYFNKSCFYTPRPIEAFKRSSSVPTAMGWLVLRLKALVSWESRKMRLRNSLIILRQLLKRERERQQSQWQWVSTQWIFYWKPFIIAIWRAGDKQISSFLSIRPHPAFWLKVKSNVMKRYSK